MGSNAGQKRSLTPFSIDDVLGPGGAIARKLERYEHREPQIAMAHAVEAAFENDRHLIVRR